MAEINIKGRTALCLSKDDIIYHVENHMGREFARYLEREMQNSTMEMHFRRKLEEVELKLTQALNAIATMKTDSEGEKK